MPGVSASTMKPDRARDGLPSGSVLARTKYHCRTKRVSVSGRGPKVDRIRNAMKSSRWQPCKPENWNGGTISKRHISVGRAVDRKSRTGTHAPLVIQHLLPFRTYLSPSLVARVLILATSLPAPGSETPVRTTRRHPRRKSRESGKEGVSDKSRLCGRCAAPSPC